MLANRQARPEVVLSLAASIAVLVALLAFGDAARVAGVATRLTPGTVLNFVGCLGAYETLRGGPAVQRRA